MFSIPTAKAVCMVAPGSIGSSRFSQPLATP